MLPSGQTLKIKAEGVLHERVEKGAYVLLEVKYGLITLLRQRPDLCDQIVNVNLECPLEEGPLVLTREVDLPAQIPPVRSTCHLFEAQGLSTKLTICNRANTLSMRTFTTRTTRGSLAWMPRIFSSKWL